MTDALALATRVLKALDAGATIERLSDTDPPFDVAAGYRAQAALVAARKLRGERPVGWKIGYTNRALQQQHGILHPIWGPMYDTTVTAVAAGATATCSLSKIAEPRIEPEIVLRMGRVPEPGMSLTDLVTCVDAVGHGFEVVTSIFRDWKGTAADTIASGSLHGRYFHGPLVPLDSGRDWLKAITDVEVTLFRNGIEVDRGVGANALDGPISALSHFINGLDRVSLTRLKVGEIVTTGTLTQALRAYPRETWSTEIRGLPVEGMRLKFT